MKVMTKIGAAVTTGALMLATITPAFANSYNMGNSGSSCGCNSGGGFSYSNTGSSSSGSNSNFSLDATYARSFSSYIERVSDQTMASVSIDASKSQFSRTDMMKYLKNMFGGMNFGGFGY